MRRERDILEFKDTEGFVLAGGKSSRMGRDKALLKFGKKTFLLNAIDIISPVCPRVSVVLNNSQSHLVEHLAAETPYIFDIHDNRGALGGIHAALENCRKPFALILACDMPLVTYEVIKKLVSSVSEDYSAVVPVEANGWLQPLCAVYRVDQCLAVLESLLSKDRSVSVRDFLKTIAIKAVPSEFLSQDPLILTNINSPIDFENIGS